MNTSNLNIVMNIGTLRRIIYRMLFSGEKETIKSPESQELTNLCTTESMAC